MSSPARQDEIVLHTPWFQVHAQKIAGDAEPYYVIHTFDFAVVVATDAQGRLLLVRQFRHALGAFTLEPPAGHVDAGETPEQSARKELCEETGYEADTLELIACLSPSTARYTNRMWVYFAANVRPAKNPAHAREAGMECVLYDGGIRALMDNPEFFAAGALAAIFAAVAKGKIPL
jgi:8-oxo-dGTP pyrophosphatase MutT (NUDIX family)